MTKVVAHFLCKEETWYLGMLMRSSLRSVEEAVDEIMILDDGCQGIAKEILQEEMRAIQERNKTTVTQVQGGQQGFGEKHNALIDRTSVDDWVLWLDADEVHHRNRLQSVCDEIRDGKHTKATRIRGYYYHFMRDPFHYRDILHRNHLLYRRLEDARWSGPVHEQLDGSYGEPADGGYLYSHYGYTKPRKQLLSQWLRYDELEGEMRYNLSGGSQLPELDPNKDLHGQFGEEGLKLFANNNHPSDVCWMTDGTLEEKGIEWTDQGQKGCKSDPDFLAPWRNHE